jgi:hypothetical protein
MRTALGLALAAALACSHEAKPTVQPDDHPPLPPASGTPIGYLIDDAGELALRDDQLTQLKAIDSDLSDRLAVLDAQQRGDRPRSGDAAAPAGRHRGGRRGGGMGGGGMPGGGMAGAGTPGRGGRGGGSRRAGAGAGSGSGGASANARAASGATNERASDVREALKRAFALFDPHQKEIATRVLSDHGVDLDTDHPGEAGEAGEAGDDADEPSTGSDGK